MNTKYRRRTIPNMASLVAWFDNGPPEALHCRSD